MGSPQKQRALLRLLADPASFRARKRWSSSLTQKLRDTDRVGAACHDLSEIIIAASVEQQADESQAPLPAGDKERGVATDTRLTNRGCLGRAIVARSVLQPTDFCSRTPGEEVSGHDDSLHQSKRCLPTATQAGGRRHATTWVIDTRAHDAAGAADACAHLGSGCLTAKLLPSNCLG